MSSTTQMGLNARTKATSRPGSLCTRNIPQGKWETHRKDLTYFKLEEGLTLVRIAELMEKKHKFKATGTQYKKQFAKWGIRSNFNKQDVALMAQRFRKSEQYGRNCIIKFNNKEVTRQDIKRYINKSKTIKSEDELLSLYPDDGQLPKHITCEDVSDSPPAFHLETPNSSLLRPGSNGSGTWSEIPLEGATQNASLLTTPMSMLSHKSSFSSFDMSDHPPSDLNFVDDSLNDFDDDEDEPMADAIYSSQLTNQCSAQRASRAIHSVVDELLYARPGARAENVNVHGYLSFTPIAMVQPQTEHDRIAADERTYYASNLPNEANATPEEQHTEANSSSFLIASFFICIFKGQAEDAGANHKELKMLVADEMAKASQIFRDMVKSGDDEMLSTLSLLLSVLHTHGHAELAMDRLQDAFSIAKEILTEANAVTRSIKHLLAVSTKASDASGEFSSDKLKEIQREIALLFGLQSKSALVATYQVGWTLLLEKKYEEAEETLGTLRWSCDKVFGSCHPHAVIPGLTLARALRYQGRSFDAQILMVEMIRRIEMVFARFHPFRLEARARQAQLLKDLEKLDYAELVLREVTQQRFAILGPSNPRSLRSFDELKNLLALQNKPVDESELWKEIVSQSTNTEFDENDKWKAYMTVKYT